MQKQNPERTKKLGLIIILLFVVAIVLTVLFSTMVTMIMFRNYNDGILTERAKVGMNVLETKLKDEIKNLNSDYWMWTQDAPFAKAINSKDASYFEETWSEYKDSDGVFCAVIAGDGTVIFSYNYPFTTFDTMSVLNGKTVDGIISQDNELAAVFAARATENDADGAVVLGFDLSSSDWMTKTKETSECDVTIFNGNLRYSTTLGSNMIGTPMGENIKKVVIDDGKPFTGTATINNKPYYVSYDPMTDLNGKVVGAYFAGSDSTDANNEFTSVTAASTITALVLVIASAVVIFIFVRKRIIIPISQVNILADEMERGQLSETSVDYVFVNDEVGTFARKLRYAKKGVSACIEDISGILTGMAGGDFTLTPKVDYPGDFEAIRENFNKIEEDLGLTLSRMNMSSDEVLTGSNQMAEGSQSLADGTTRQASAIQQISATIADVSTQISHTAQNAAQAGELSKQTQDKVNQQDSEIQSMVNAMNEISETSKEIEKIIKTIEDISFQTNILALNAAVEAARAGDAGKGFAVVADEVRNLATKSAEAANSTTSLITASIDAVDKGSKIALSTAESMKEVKDMSAQTAALISEIASASAEQNESIRQITTGVEQISQVIQMNSATAEETAASCEELSGQSRLLKDQVARFKVNA